MKRFLRLLLPLVFCAAMLFSLLSFSVYATQTCLCYFYYSTKDSSSASWGRSSSAFNCEQVFPQGYIYQARLDEIHLVNLAPNRHYMFSFSFNMSGNRTGGLVSSLNTTITYTQGLNNISYGLEKNYIAGYETGYAFYISFDTSDNVTNDVFLIFDSPLLFSADSYLSATTLLAKQNICSYDIQPFLNIKLNSILSRLQDIDSDIMHFNDSFDTFVSGIFTNHFQNLTFFRVQTFSVSTFPYNQVVTDLTTGVHTVTRGTANFWWALVRNTAAISDHIAYNANVQNIAGAMNWEDGFEGFSGSGIDFDAFASDFDSMGQAASWNSSSFSDQTTTGFLSWFSQEVKDSLDAVPAAKSGETEVDFLTGNIEEIERGIGK